MTADTPHPTHAIGTAVLMVNYRGGRAAKPKALRGLTVTIEWGYTYGTPPASKGCHVEHTRVTLAARQMGVKSMTTLWCPR